MYENPGLAVSEWRNVLQSCQNSQLLPLLYVANEVLQTSKRNRGNKFLEAFGPVLGGSLRYMCERDPKSTERVRRTAKIWGDRRVFSLRYVGEILAGLESFRNGDQIVSQSQTQSRTQTQPQPQTQPRSASNTNIDTNRSSNSNASANANANANDSDSDDADDLFGDDHDPHVSIAPIADDDASFGESSGPSLLKVSNFSVAASASTNSNTAQPKKVFGASGKRRRSLTSAPTHKNRSAKKGKSPPRKKAKSNKLSASSLMERIQQLENIDAEYHSISNIISTITSSDLCNNVDDIQEVGDELTDLHVNMNETMDTVRKHRGALYNIANQKKEAEMELKRYLVWMKGALSTDEVELKLCAGLEETLTNLQVVHADAKRLRDEKRAKEEKERQIKEEAERKKAKEEELQRSLEQIQRKDGPKEGMVWNKQAREYQYLADATEESWRD